MKQIAVIGTGIAGMSCASRLNDKFDITIYEKNHYVGGHTNTVEVDEEGVRIPIDTGFMVYNEGTYPNLTRLLAELEVPTKPTKMSFSLQHTSSGLEFAGTGLGGLFAQSRRVFSPSHWKFLLEINRFNETCGEVLTDPVYAEMTLERYCEARGFSEKFRDQYLVPMSSAVWSSPPGAMLDFPASTLVRFFTNHRFLSLNGQFVWRTVIGGSQRYRDELIRPFRDRILTNRQVSGVLEREGKVIVKDVSGHESVFDAVVLASHADESLGLLENPSDLQKELLSAWKYQKNIATLHGDESVMPRAKRAWASWNYRIDAGGPSTVYWMNSLQEVSKKKNYFVSINDPGNLDSKLVIKQIEYHHPLYTVKSIETQSKLASLNEAGRIYFCGSYFKYGFHEDALTSGLMASEAVVRRLG